MSKGGRLSRLLPKLFRSNSKLKSDSASSEAKGPFCQVVFLDDAEQRIPFKSTWKGQILFDKVCEMIDLSERDYFGLRFVDDTGQACWLDLVKSVASQLKACSPPHKFYFCVKFYVADPCKLLEEVTRYLFFLQVKRDILQGRLPVSHEEAAELFAYAVQSELGDFDPHSHTPGYVSEFYFLPHQTEKLEAQIASLHRRCRGATPVMAEHRFLERVKWLEMYGVDLHPVQGDGSVEYFLGLMPTGIVVYKHKTKVACYFWPRLIKCSHKGKIFSIRVKDKNNEEHICAFELQTKPACKHLWKCCVEHHAFFSGRSERLASKEQKYRDQRHVQRAPSRRQPRRVSSDSRLNAEEKYQEQFSPYSRGTVTMMGHPQPIRRPRHRSLPELMGNQSPRSVRSAPWQSRHDYGLYTSGHDSPTSDFSMKRDKRHTNFVSAGSDSESGISQRKRYFPNRKGSDNESEASTSRRRRREVDTDSDSEVSLTHSGQSKKKWLTHAQRSASNNDSYIFIPSANSAQTDEMKQRRRRRRSKSPNNSKRPPEELKQHIAFDLVDTEGMTEDQLRGIPYTKVETKASLFRVKYSPNLRQKIWASRRTSYGANGDFYSDKGLQRTAYGAQSESGKSYNGQYQQNMSGDWHRNQRSISQHSVRSSPQGYDSANTYQDRGHGVSHVINSNQESAVGREAQLSHPRHINQESHVGRAMQSSQPRHINQESTVGREVLSSQPKHINQESHVGRAMQSSQPRHINQESTVGREVQSSQPRHINQESTVGRAMQSSHPRLINQESTVGRAVESSHPRLINQESTVGRAVESSHPRLINQESTVGRAVESSHPRLINQESTVGRAVESSHPRLINQESTVGRVAQSSHPRHINYYKSDLVTQL